MRRFVNTQDINKQTNTYVCTSKDSKIYPIWNSGKYQTIGNYHKALREETVGFLIDVKLGFPTSTSTILSSIHHLELPRSQFLKWDFPLVKLLQHYFAFFY